MISVQQRLSIRHVFSDFFPHDLTDPSGLEPFHYRYSTITLGHMTLGHMTFIRTSLDEWSARRIDVYMTEHNTKKKT